MSDTIWILIPLARVRVLERIVTDKGIDVADEIEKLREAPLN